MSEKRKKVLIVGGGVSGITSGIYLQENGYDTEVFELNACPGGACTGWERKGQYIDGCIHWLTGTNPESSYNFLWKDTHAILPDTHIYYQEEFGKLDFGNGRHITLWTDVSKLEDELVSYAPEDVDMIREFCFLIRRFQRIEGPVHKPVDMMNIAELIIIGLTMAGDYYWISRTSKIDCAEYGERFTNKDLQKMFSVFMAPGYNLMSLLYMLGHVSAKNGGIPAGGSKAMAERMASHYLSLGGKLRTGARVSEIITEKNRATGIKLAGNEKIYGDWIVSSAPVEHTLKELLGGRYRVKAIDKRLNDETTYPVYTYTTVIFRCSRNLENESIGTTVFFDPIKMDKDYECFSVRNYSYDKTLKHDTGSVVIEVGILGNDGMYYYWKGQKECGSYAEKKKWIADEVLKRLENKLPEYTGTLELLDVVTPCTYERYLNSRHGNFQGFVHTSKGKQLMQKGIVPGLKNFILSGQWIFYSGGLPTAAITGRFAAQRICRADGKKFIRPAVITLKLPQLFVKKEVIR